MIDECENCSFALQDLDIVVECLKKISERLSSAKKFQLRLAKEKNDFKQRAERAEERLEKAEEKLMRIGGFK